MYKVCIYRLHNLYDDALPLSKEEEDEKGRCLAWFSCCCLCGCVWVLTASTQQICLIILRYANCVPNFYVIIILLNSTYICANCQYADVCVLLLFIFRGVCVLCLYIYI